MSPMRPTPEIPGAAASSLDVRCPICHKRHFVRAENTRVVLIVVQQGAHIARGVVLKCRCGAFLQEVHYYEAAA